MRELFVSLGHNSSAVLAVDGVVKRGYEQERFDRVKSSSAYPRDAISRVLQTEVADVAYVSHWFDKTELETNRYLDLSHLDGVAMRIIGLTTDYSHHDAHAASAATFLASHNWYRDPSYVVILDGFGTHQECFSFYDAHPGDRRPRLKHRTYGYKMSLGLMYQYTTEYLGLKPNKDEYKLLGYESHVTEYVAKDECLRIMGRVQRQAYEHAHRMLDATSRPEPRDGLIDYTALENAKAYWWAVANRWRSYWPTVMDEDGVKACVAYCAQTFLEACVDALITSLYNPEQRRALILAGGCFYNVKLNRRLMLRQDRPRVFAHPLSGDQGAALGMSAVHATGLLWGERSLGHASLPPNASYADASTWMDVAGALIEAGHVVNVVRGSMEFGPRALCNTTTFALPTKENVTRINWLNERDEAMPMAPVMTRTAAMRFLRHDELLMIPISDRYMITTCAFADIPPDRMLGVAHKDPTANVWTARPQIVDDGDVYQLLRSMPDETLINTSYNYHGEPIVFTEDDAIRTHQMQCFRAKTLGVDEPITLLVTK